MGGNYKDVRPLALKVRELGLKTSWYTGMDKLPQDLNGFNYIKIGHYDSKYGGLTSPTTNQKFYSINPESFGYSILDITSKFTKNANR